MSQAWAKCPSKCTQVRNRSRGDLKAPREDSDAFLPTEDSHFKHPSGEGFLPDLSYLRWRQHKGGATAALMMLFALAIKSNLDQKTQERRTGNQVVATYEHIMALTNLSRGPISKAYSCCGNWGDHYDQGRQRLHLHAVGDRHPWLLLRAPAGAPAGVEN